MFQSVYEGLYGFGRGFEETGPLVKDLARRDPRVLTGSRWVHNLGGGAFGLGFRVLASIIKSHGKYAILRIMTELYLGLGYSQCSMTLCAES